MSARGWFPADVELRDGGLVHIRPLRAEDEPLVAAELAQLSAESRRLRFFSPIPRISPALLRWHVDVDQHDHLALLALRADRPDVALGEARAIRSRVDPLTADVAVTVLDAHHRRGVGSALLRALRRSALAVGIERFEGHVMVGNGAALEWLRASGARIARDEPGVYRFTIPLRTEARDHHVVAS